VAGIAWEDLLDHIRKTDSGFGGALHDFYRKCCEFNHVVGAA
jgi:hypothetical protein